MLHLIHFFTTILFRHHGQSGAFGLAKRAAQVARARQAKTPRLVDRLGDSYPRSADQRVFRGPCSQAELWSVGAFASQFENHAQGLSETGRSRTEQARSL